MTGRIWVACRTGRIFDPVIAQRPRYADSTTAWNDCWLMRYGANRGSPNTGPVACHGCPRSISISRPKNTANLRIITWIDRCPAVVGYACPHFLEAIDTIGESVPLPGLGHAQRGKAIKEAATHDTVMRVVGLEEERLTHGYSAKLASSARSPEVHHGNLGPDREEVIPLVVRHADVATARP